MFENKQRDEITTKSSRVFSQLSKRLAALGSNPWIPVALAILGGIIFLIQIWTYIHTLDSNLDEGAYLYKGYLFITGQYTPYQDYGPWSNKMPLSFLIPGLVQYVFGTGIGTARYFTVILAALIVLGVWILACRLGGRWWGAVSVWVFALNPAIIKMYSLSVSQVLVAFLLVWTLVFTLGEDRKTWQIALGAFIAGIMVMTRINMLFVIPLLILYIFWEHGLRSSLIAAVIATATIIIIHAIYWPGILIIWAHAIPRSLSPFLNKWRPLGVVDTWSPVTSTRERLLASISGDQVPLCCNRRCANHMDTLGQKKQTEEPGELPRISISFECLLNPAGASFICIHWSRFLCLLFFRLLIFLCHGWIAAGRSYFFFMEYSHTFVAFPDHRSTHPYNIYRDWLQRI